MDTVTPSQKSPNAIPKATSIDSPMGTERAKARFVEALVRVAKSTSVKSSRRNG